MYNNIKSNIKTSKHEENFGGGYLLTRNVYIDCLRGIAALLVILYHYTTRYDNLFGHAQDYAVQLPWGGVAGVTAFFCLSGYFAAVGLSQKTNPIKFLIKKVFRLYPVYWIAIVITFIATTFLLAERAVPIKDAAVNFTMLQDLFGFANVDGAYWTQIYDLIFYVDIFLILCLGLRKKSDIVVLSWSLIMLLPELLPMLNNVPYSYFYKLTRPFMLWGYGQVFAAGMAVYYILYGNKRSRIISSFTVIFCATRQILICNLAQIISLIAVITFVIVATIVQMKGITPSKSFLRCVKPLTFIASISYPLYLIHQNCGYIIIRNMEKIGLTSEVFLIVPIVITIVLAWLMAKYIEKPCISFSAKVLSNFKDKKQ